MVEFFRLAFPSRLRDVCGPRGSSEYTGSFCTTGCRVLLREATFQVAFVNCNNVIQEITPATPYPTLCHSILPRTFRVALLTTTRMPTFLLWRIGVRANLAKPRPADVGFVRTRGHFLKSWMKILFEPGQGFGRYAFFNPLPPRRGLSVVPGVFLNLT
jgi:hypothetical protein